MNLKVDKKIIILYRVLQSFKPALISNFHGPASFFLYSPLFHPPSMFFILIIILHSMAQQVYRFYLHTP